MMETSIFFILSIRYFPGDRRGIRLINVMFYCCFTLDGLSELQASDAGPEDIRCLAARP